MYHIFPRNLCITVKIKIVIPVINLNELQLFKTIEHFFVILFNNVVVMLQLFFIFGYGNIGVNYRIVVFSYNEGFETQNNYIITVDNYI